MNMCMCVCDLHCVILVQPTKSFSLCTWVCLWYFIISTKLQFLQMLCTMSQHLRTLLTAPFPDSLSYAKQLFVNDERNFLHLCLRQVFFIESKPICVQLVFKIRTTSLYSNRISLKPIIRFSPCISPINASLFLVHYRWQCSCTKSFDVF